MEDSTRRKAKSSSFLMPIIGLILIFVAIIIFIMFLTNGEIIYTGDTDNDQVTERLSCESNKVAYPLFKYDNSNSKSLKINATFSNNSIHSISLIYKLEYTNSEMIATSESENHASMNLDFQANKLGADAFSATYSKLKDGLQMSLFATSTDINSKALKYFMLDKLSGNSYSSEKVAEVYNKQGLNCEIKKQQDN